jgi:hypothetical protein
MQVTFELDSLRESAGVAAFLESCSDLHVVGFSMQLEISGQTRRVFRQLPIQTRERGDRSKEIKH